MAKAPRTSTPKPQSNEAMLDIERPLTEDEKTGKAKEGIYLSEAHDKLNDDFKTDRATWRQRIKEAKDQRDAAHKAYLTGSVREQITCVVSADMERKVMQFIHQGRVVKERKLSTEEIEQYGTKPMFDAPKTDAQSDVAQVMAEEKNAKTKTDHVSAN